MEYTLNVFLLLLTSVAAQNVHLEKISGAPSEGIVDCIVFINDELNAPTSLQDDFVKSILTTLKPIADVSADCNLISP